MKNIIYILIILSLPLNAVPVKNELKIKKEQKADNKIKKQISLKNNNKIKTDPKKELAKWHNENLIGKINQEEASLLVQRMYYLFLGIDEVFKSKKIDKNKLLPISNAINEINANIRKLDKGHISKAFKQINKKLNSFKVFKKDPEKTIMDFFDYLTKIYEVLYATLKDKKITIGYDKNKNLPEFKKIILPTDKEIVNFLNNIKLNKKNRKN